MVKLNVSWMERNIPILERDRECFNEKMEPLLDPLNTLFMHLFVAMHEYSRLLQRVYSDCVQGSARPAFCVHHCSARHEPQLDTHNHIQTGGVCPKPDV